MAEMPKLDGSQDQTSETGPKGAINIEQPNIVVIGDNNKVSLDNYEEIASAKYTHPAPHYGSVKCDGEHTNKNTGLVCQNCGATRRNTTDCTHQPERPRLAARPKSCCDKPSYRPRTQQIQIENHLQSKYAPGRSASRRPKGAHRIVNYPPEGTFNCKQFIRRIDASLEDLAKATGEKRKEIEHFILHVLLPKLEYSCTEWSEVGETSLVVAKLSCARVNNEVTMHALELLLQLVSRNKLEGHTDKLQQIEKEIRRFIASVSFNEEKPQLQEKRVVVFSHLLMLSLNEMSKNVYLHFTTQDQTELKEVVTILGKRFRSRPEHTSDSNPHLKLALDIVSEAVDRLLETSSLGEQHSQFREKFNFLLWSTDDPQNAKKNTKFHKKLSSQSWFDVVFTIYHINGQGIKHVPPTEKMRMLRFLVGGCAKERKILKSGKTKNHNNEFLAAATVLFDIMLQNRDKFIQLEAMKILKDWYQTALKGGFSISSTVVHEIKRYMWMTLFWRNTGAIAAEHLFDLRFPAQEVPQVHIEEYLELFHKRYSLEMREYSDCDTVNSCYFKKGGFFRGVPSVTKILKLKVGEMSQKMPPAKALEDLVNEAHYLYKLSTNPHPNIVQLLAFNTSEPPYHIITEYIAGDTLQNYFKKCRENNYAPPQSFLIDICLSVAKGARFLSHQGFVHRGLTLSNILIGDDNVCKITAMETVRPLRSNIEENKNAKSIPEYKSRKEDFPITHAAPESLREWRFSTASDIWGFGILMWEVFTYGCPALSISIDGICFRGNSAEIKKYIMEGKKLPIAACFYEETYSLMEECWNIDPTLRPSFDELIRDLEKLRETFKGSESPPATPPTMLGSMEDLELIPQCASEEHNLQHSAAIYSEPIMSNVQKQRNNELLIGNSSNGMKAVSQGYMPLTERKKEEYQFRTVEKNAKPVSRLSGDTFILGNPPVTNAHHKIKAEGKGKGDETATEKLRRRMQSLGKPVLPQDIQQSLTSKVDLNGEKEMKSFSVHQEDECEEEVYDAIFPENDEFAENAAEMDDGFGDTDDYGPISVDDNLCHHTALRGNDVCHSPIYESLPENERTWSELDFQETYDDVCSYKDKSTKHDIVYENLPQRRCADKQPKEDERPDSGLDFDDTKIHDDVGSYENENIYETVYY